jgi:LacI family transcriptional regulator
MSKTTIAHIAQELKVTPSTVSRALAGSERISEKMRAMVRAKAKELGYEPNVMASSLRTGVNNTVGMIVPRINRQFFSNVISGVEAILNPAGYNLLICQTHERYADEVKAVNTLLAHRVAGVLVSHSVETADTAHLQKVIDKGMVLVQFDRVLPGLNGSQIVNDNFNGAFLATKHLVKSGYKKVGHLAGPLSVSVYAERNKGYEAALNDTGTEPDESLVFENVITREGGYAAIEKALAAGCDALYCSGDYAAMGVVQYCRANNIDIPAGFGVVGTANESFAELITPSLTTLEQNSFDMGNQVASAFLSKIKGDGFGNGNYTIPMRLIVRESSLRQPIHKMIINV